MIQENSENIRFAVLIDSENISSVYAGIIFDEIEKYGQATYRRIYGDWSMKSGWRDMLAAKAITPVQQFSYTRGKNSTDSSMIIDAMDILYSNNVSGFCLVTSDSDFTRLAMRLRESGMMVIGMGESKTPRSFREACSRFATLDLIYDSEKNQNEQSDNPKADSVAVTALSEIEKTIADIVSENKNNGKCTYLSGVGSRLTNKYPDFDVRNYGYTKFLTFVNDGCKTVILTRKGDSYAVDIKNAKASKQEIETLLEEVLRKNGNGADNLSVVHSELKKVYPDFDVKQYGYAKMSSFLRSFGRFEVKNNAVRIIEK